MNKTFKAIGIVFAATIIWSILVYIALAFLKAESNPFAWSEGHRFAMIFLIFCFAISTPLMVVAIKDELK